uniref:Mitochondrial carrier protein n=1 Tax=Corethron hystrix TaxID=216773 RepID=A0A7S1BPG3_9STRA|mmetsp:Transcript_33822/g.78102  ORF Transcript_33822/g.78102 Transcript_33822/m.78102 type:complete len:252 (+) Transcript_33822:14-769(+)
MPISEIIGATCAGCASTLIGHPLDTLKVHLQTGSQLSNNAVSAARSLFTVHGPGVFFRGIGPPLFNAVLMNTVMFSVFNSFKDSSQSALYAGFISGIATAFISTPTDFIKVQAQVTGGNSREVLRKIVLRHPMALFRGHIPNLAREGIFTMVYLGFYDCLTMDKSTTGLAQTALISSFTGGLAWIISYPCDTVKSIMQSSQRDILVLDAIKIIWRRGGLSFYRGCGTSTGRAILVTSIRMITYEYVRNISY